MTSPDAAVASLALSKEVPLERCAHCADNASSFWRPLHGVQSLTRSRQQKRSIGHRYSAST
ncbi:hypothetical protein LPU83_pLPU83b_0477 (plasmid) [Rhizobium favelukesii]|uniref:Uncharacterized protein n=1 Tax=Rhizobium favelukesii TaxID=348824 RepID=W6RJK4_9HYPH|nr:hypothetical protein LPU83_pLPU83b_0477 [Rhizobium favelukesii]